MELTNSDGTGTSQQGPQQPATKKLLVTFLNGREFEVEYSYDPTKAPKDRVEIIGPGVDEVLFGGMKIPIGEPNNYEYVFDKKRSKNKENPSVDQILRHEYCYEHVEWWLEEYLKPAIAFQEGTREYYQMIENVCRRDTVTLSIHSPEFVSTPNKLLDIVKQRVCSRVLRRTCGSKSKSKQ